MPEKNRNTTEQMIHSLDTVRDECIRIIQGKNITRLSRVIPVSAPTLRDFQEGRIPNPRLKLLKEILYWKNNGALYLEEKKSEWTVEKNSSRTSAFPAQFLRETSKGDASLGEREREAVSMLTEYLYAKIVILPLKNGRPKYKQWRNYHFPIEKLIRCIRAGESIAMAQGRNLQVLEIDTAGEGKESWERFCDEANFRVPVSVLLPGRFHIYLRGVNKNTCPETNPEFPGMRMLRRDEFCPVAGSVLENGTCTWGPDKVPDIFPVVRMSKEAYEIWANRGEE